MADASVNSVRIVVRLNATLEVGDAYGGSAWAKPGIEASVGWDGKPTDEQIEREWRWLWDTQVNPQFQGLIDILKEESRKLPEPQGDGSKRVLQQAEEAPQGAVYG